MLLCIVRKPKLAILVGMYESLASFLQEISSQTPLLWALLVMVVVATTALGLYTLWELVMRLVRVAWNGSRAQPGGRG